MVSQHTGQATLEYDIRTLLCASHDGSVQLSVDFRVGSGVFAVPLDGHACLACLCAEQVSDVDSGYPEPFIEHFRYRTFS